MPTNNEKIQENAKEILQTWLVSCTRRGKVSRNTIAVGLVILDKLRRSCPVLPEDMFSEGGEVKGSRAGLKNILQKYNVPQFYLKKATTRQSHQDGRRLLEAFNWGELFVDLDDLMRDSLIQTLIDILITYVEEWRLQQTIKIDCDRRQSPTTWIHAVIESAKFRSGGVVEQHLIGAKLARRHKSISISNYPAHAADAQTLRDGDFAISQYVYHVTASPGRSVIQKCSNNLRTGKNAILLVPNEKKQTADVLATEEGIHDELIILSIEDFVAVNIIELAIEEGLSNFSVLQEIVSLYNQRLAEVETDLSLQIEIQ